MKTRRIFTSVILALVLALVSITSALAVPPNPNSFFGTVKVNGANVSAGTAVTAWCGGVKYATSSYLLYNGDTVYAFNVPGDDLSTTGVVEGCTSGQTIIFKIGQLVADQTWSWTSGTNINLNLTATDPTAVPLTISGNVRGAGAIITYTGSTSGSTVADGFGNYSFEVRDDWTGMVTPSLSGYTFYPSQRTYANVLYNLSNQNYTAVVGNPPALPSSFFGTVKSNGANVPSGITVTARINGHIYAKSAFIIYQGDTVYSLDVPGDDPSTTDIVEGGVEGDIVEFYVGNIKADQTGTWHTGKNVELNLTVVLPDYYQIYLPLIIR